MTAPSELERRRRILVSHIGHEIQLHPARCSPKDPLRGLSGVLSDVKRKRAHIDYGPQVGVWIVPIESILLPGALVPEPRQRPLFDET